MGTSFIMSVFLLKTIIIRIQKIDTLLSCFIFKNHKTTITFRKYLKKIHISNYAKTKCVKKRYFYMFLHICS